VTKIALYGALFGVISLSAQDAALKKKLDEAMAQVVSDEIISAKTVKGAPYSAQSTSESVQVLADGNRITNTNSTTIYRDSQGRERREQSSGAEGTVRSIRISDPVEGVSYTLRPETRIALKNFQPKLMTIRQDKEAVKAKMDLESIMKAEVPTIMMDSTISSSQPAVSLVNSKVENLGSKMIEGISADGTRRTTTFPAGQIGNELPIVTVNERWYSPELQVVVMSMRSDPRTGTTTYRLTNINRSEPTPTLFQVPPDYTLQDLTGGRSVSKPEER
jgi:hypothetical protein